MCPFGHITDMRIQRWLEDVFGSPMRVSLLRFLDRTHPTEHTLREMARALATGHSSVRVAVVALEAMGIVESRRLGNSNGYRMRPTKLRPLVGEIFAAERRLERLAEHAIAGATPKGTSVFLFGSAARRTQTAESDLDLLIIAPDARTARNTADGIRTALAPVGFLRPQTFPLSKKDVGGKEGEPWFERAKRDARHVVGPKLESWL